MRETMRWTTFALCLAAVGCRAGASGSDARMRLTAVLRDSLGADAGASVGFKVDNGQRESHLYLTFDSTLVPNVPDSVFARRARDIALFALRHYEKASEVDSITVAARDQLQPGAWRVVHSSVFAVASLRAATPTPTPVSVDTSRPQESLQESLTIPEACDAFAKILTASATANGKPATEVGTPRDTSMSFGEEWHGRPESACRVAWRNEDSREAPLEDVLTRAKSGGWTERGGLLLADGPDGSVLAVSRGNVACVVSGSWDGGDDSDSTYVPSPGFEIAASCFANRPDRY